VFPILFSPPSTDHGGTRLRLLLSGKFVNAYLYKKSRAYVAGQPSLDSRMPFRSSSMIVCLPAGTPPSLSRYRLAIFPLRDGLVPLFMRAYLPMEPMPS
jgi:hypothetical protein